MTGLEIVSTTLPISLPDLQASHKSTSEKLNERMKDLFGASRFRKFKKKMYNLLEVS